MPTKTAKKPAKTATSRPKTAAKAKPAPPAPLPTAVVPLTEAQLAQVKAWWDESIVKAVLEELEASEALLTKVIELVPTSSQAHFSRSNVRKRRKDRKGQNADLKRSKQLAALAEEHGWPEDVILALKRERLNPTPVEQVPFEKHTITPAAAYYCAAITADELASVGLAAKGSGPLRIVVGVHSTKTSYEAVAFGEAKRGRSWSMATPKLLGDPAEKLVQKLADTHQRYRRLFDTFDEVLDGFEEQEMLQDDFD